MSARNCLGITVEQLKQDLKKSLPVLVSKILVTKITCDNTAQINNALSNINDFNLFILKEGYDRLDNIDRSSGLIESSTPYKWIDQNFNNYLSVFTDMICDGTVQNLTDLNNKYPIQVALKAGSTDALPLNVNNSGNQLNNTGTDVNGNSLNNTSSGAGSGSLAISNANLNALAFLASLSTNNSDTTVGNNINGTINGITNLNGNSLTNIGGGTGNTNIVTSIGFGNSVTASGNSTANTGSNSGRNGSLLDKAGNSTGRGNTINFNVNSNGAGTLNNSRISNAIGSITNSGGRVTPIFANGNVIASGIPSPNLNNPAGSVASLINKFNGISLSLDGTIAKPIGNSNVNNFDTNVIDLGLSPIDGGSNTSDSGGPINLGNNVVIGNNTDRSLALNNLNAGVNSVPTTTSNTSNYSIDLAGNNPDPKIVPPPLVQDSGNIPLFPSSLTDGEKEIILGILKDNGLFNVNDLNWNNNILNSRNSIVIDDSTEDKTLNVAKKLGGTVDSTQVDSNGNIIGSVTNPNDSVIKVNPNNKLVNDNLFGAPDGITIPDSEINKLSLTVKHYKCFSRLFSLDQYINTFGTNQLPIITPDKVANLKNIHNNILLPIYNYYYRDIDDNACYLRIVEGLAIQAVIESYLGGTQVSLHMRGLAVDFRIVGIDVYQIIEDVTSGRINIDYGIISPNNGVHITLPYVFNGKIVKGMYLKSNGAGYKDIEMTFNN